MLFPPPLPERHEPPFGEIRVAESSIHGRTVAERPQGFTSSVDAAPCGLGFHSQTDELPCHRTLALPVPELDRPQPSSDMSVQHPQCSFRIRSVADAKEADPAEQIRIQTE